MKENAINGIYFSYRNEEVEIIILKNLHLGSIGTYICARRDIS